MNIEDLKDAGAFIDDKEAFLASIAISLKRIADTLDHALYTTDYHGRQTSLTDELCSINDRIRS